MALNTSNFQTVFDDNFAKDISLNTSLWGNSWGYSSQYVFGGGALTITSLQSQYFYPVGFMQATPGKSAGEGYGLYQFSGYANAGQGQGISFIMWRADNAWLDTANPGTISEIDVLESWDGTVAGESTLHWYAANAKYNDGYTSKQFNIDLTKPHTYAVDWERGSLTFYIDGQKLYQVTSNVPLDAADGGSNEVMGAQVINGSATSTSNSVALHITDMSYSAPLGTVAPPPPPTPPSNPNPVTLGGGAQSYVAAVGATVQAGSGGDTITAAGGLVQVTGGAGSLDFIGGSAPSTVLGGAGSATLFGGAGGGVYSGGTAGQNLLVSQGVSGANTTLTGGGAGDRIFGSAAGHDVLVAGPGRASILGGGGTTSITGGASAASVIFTGSGATTVSGGAAGGDTIVGGAGGLSVNANRGDAIFGNAGTLAVNGSSSGADSIVGGSGSLSVAGQGANMLVVAGSGSSVIDTGSGASLIFAGGGSSSVTGGSGSMQVVLGSGSATVTEGSGAAVYDLVKGSAGGNFVLNGFRPGTDKIELYGYQQADLHTSSSAGSTMLNLVDGTRIQLVGVGNVGHSIIG